MSQMYGTSPGSGSLGEDVHPTGSGSESTRDVAAEEARGVAGDTKAATEQTAATAKEQAAQVAGEAKVQARQVYDQAKQELDQQVQSQHQRAAGGLSALADELTSLVQGTGDQQGMAHDLAQQASDRVREAADWLSAREPGEVLDEVRSFARRRPGAFLAAAAVVGLVGGRLTRGLADQAREDDSTASPAAGYPTTTTTPVYAPEVAVPVSQSAFDQPAYDQAPSGLSTMPMPAMGTPPLDDPLDGPLVTGPSQTTVEPFGEERP